MDVATKGILNHNLCICNQLSLITNFYRQLLEEKRKQDGFSKDGGKFQRTITPGNHGNRESSEDEETKRARIDLQRLERERIDSQEQQRASGELPVLCYTA